MRLRSLCLSALLCAVSAPGMFAQQATSGSSVPRLVSFGGVIKDAAGKPVTTAVPVTFSLFAEQEGGTALWTETQVVNTDAQGHYSVFLGAMNPNGLPLDVFTSGAARWLAVEPGVPGAINGARVLLVGVPYALKAADADTLGGKPASAFLTVAPQGQATAGDSSIAAVTPTGPSPALSGTGTANFVPLWTSGANLGDSILFQNSASMEVQGALALPSTGTATSSTGFDSQPFDLFASAYNSSSHAGVAQHFRWQAEPTLNDTSSPSGKLDLLYASGTNAPAETGLAINPHGVISFAPGQTFPGTGPGTITGVTAGTDLKGGGTSGTVTLNVDTTKVPQLKAANNFIGNQAVTGNIAATGSVSGVSGSFAGGGTYTYGSSYGLKAYETSNSQDDYAVLGYAEGSSAQTFGVFGHTSSTAGSGVYGQIIGASVEGSAIGAEAAAGVWGDTNVDEGQGVLGTADTGIGGAFFTNSDLFWSVFAENDYNNNGTYGDALFAGGVGGSCTIDGSGDLSCTGSKSAVVPVDGGSRKVALYAVEAPENWFEDFGSGQLSGGAAHVQLEPVFAQTVNTGMEYHVFLTPEGDCKGLYVAGKTAQGFEVRELSGGQSSVEFSYRIVARRKGFEAIRLADKTKDLDPSRMPRRKARASSKPLVVEPIPAVAIQK